MINKQNYESFKDYLRQNKLSTIIVIIITFLTYGFLIFHFGFSIDTEDIIQKQMTFYKGWIGINRYGLVLTKAIFGLLTPIPGYTIFLMVLTTLGYSIVWTYFWDYIKGFSNGGFKYNWIFSVVFISAVPMVELVSFQCQSFEIAFTMLLCGVSLLFQWKWINGNGRKWYLLCSVLTGVWCFASYQAFVALYISATLAAFLVQYQNQETKVQKKPIKTSLILIMIFLLNYILYTSIGKCIRAYFHIDAGAYTENMIQWGKVPANVIWNTLKEYMQEIIFAKTIYWNWGYLFVCIGLLIITLKQLCIKKQLKDCYYAMVVVIFLFSPFLLPIAMGTAPVVRGQLALPGVVAIGMQIIVDKLANFSILKKYKGWELFLVSVCFLFVIRENITTDNRLLYTDYVVRQQENTLTSEIIEKIEALDKTDETKITILGNWSPTYNPSMLRGETLGYSFYEWDATVPGGTQNRVINYWRALGYNYNGSSPEQIEQAEETAKTMPSWPADGSVKKEGNNIIVKLSE